MSDNMDEPYPQSYHPNGYCEGAGICTHCGRTLFDEYFKVESKNKPQPQDGPVPIGSSNQDLIDQTKRVHGELYHRLNSIQRELNIKRESLRKSQAYAIELENANRELVKYHIQDNSQTQIPAPIMQALRVGGMPERFNTIESITDWIKLIVHL